jgi:hypothetical protein
LPVTCTISFSALFRRFPVTPLERQASHRSGLASDHSEWGPATAERWNNDAGLVKEKPPNAERN